MEEIEKNIYELRDVAGLISNLEENSSTGTYFDNMMYVLSNKLYEIADNLDKIDKEKRVKCFYCFRSITVSDNKTNNCNVDHFPSYILRRIKH